MSLAERLIEEKYVEIKTDDRFLLDIRYSSVNNFTRTNVYNGFDRAFLHPIAADKLFLAVDRLQKKHRGFRFIIFDAFRPRPAQKELWKFVEGTPEEKYIANPARGSIHNYGLAIDLSILDAQDKELDMGTAFDEFTELAQPQLEEKFLNSGVLSKLQHSNRLILREVMLSSGFLQLPHEWWHYDALPGDQVRGIFPIIE